MESKETLGNRGSHRKDSDWVICWDSCRDSGNRVVILRMSLEFDGEGAESDVVAKAPGCDGQGDELLDMNRTERGWY